MSPQGMALVYCYTAFPLLNSEMNKLHHLQMPLELLLPNLVYSQCPEKEDPLHCQVVLLMASIAPTFTCSNNFREEIYKTKASQSTIPSRFLNMHKCHLSLTKKLPCRQHLKGKKICVDNDKMSREKCSS